MALGFASSITVDLAFCLQGNAEEELPEVLLGCCRFTHVDISSAIKFP